MLSRPARIVTYIVVPFSLTLAIGHPPLRPPSHLPHHQRHGHHRGTPRPRRHTSLPQHQDRGYRPHPHRPLPLYRRRPLRKHLSDTQSRAHLQCRALRLRHPPRLPRRSRRPPRPRPGASTHHHPERARHRQAHPALHPPLRLSLLHQLPRRCPLPSHDLRSRRLL